MAESSIWWVVLSDSNNVLCDWELLMGFQIWIARLYTPPGMNSGGHNHYTCAISFTLVIGKYV